MEKKYELLEDDFKEINDKKIYRIKALRDFGNVKKGQLGGYIEKEYNLSHIGVCWINDDTCWVYDNAKVYNDAIVSGDVDIYGNARIYENARVSELVNIYGAAKVYGNANIYGCVGIYGKADICGNALVYGNACVFDNAKIYENASVYEYVDIFGNADISGNAKIYGNANVYGDVTIYENADINISAHVFSISNIGSRSGTTTFFRNNDNQIFVKCGCFKNNIDEFEKAVKETHKENKHAQMYLLAIQLAKIQINTEK